MFKKLAVIGTAVLLGITPVPSTFAQTLQIGPDGVRIREPGPVDGAGRRGIEIDERQATRIARSEGVRDVDSVRRMRSRYVVEGMDRRGNDIRVSIDRRTGEVLSVD